MTDYIFDIETTGLDSINSRITCIVLMNINTEEIISFYGQNEKCILDNFWNFVNKNVTKLFSFYGDSFDLPFIIKRSIINNEKINIVNHIDLAKVINSLHISNKPYEKGKLSDWAKILGFEVKTENGFQMLKYFEEKRFIKIKQHCEEDVKITLELYKRCKYCGVLDEIKK